jgi:hypothetical protein
LHVSAHAWRIHVKRVWREVQSSLSIVLLASGRMRAALRCAVLCFAVLCCAVLCCAVLCCAVLCCAVLCSRYSG